MQVCREYADLQKKAVEIRWALNDQVAALAGPVQRDEVAGLSIDFTLMGDRKGTWSLSVTRNRRLTLRIDSAEREICDLNLEDYH